MIVYKDFLTGDELFSDIYPMKLIGENETIIQLRGKRVTENTGIDESSIGANPSAEEAAEGTEDSSVSGVNIVLACRLKEVAEYTLKEYKQKMREYCPKLVAAREAYIVELEEQNRKDKAEKMREELAYFKKNFQKDLQEVIIGPFKKKDFQFFVGESLNDPSMLALMTYPEEDPEGRPLMYFIKHGLKEEKV